MKLYHFRFLNVLGRARHKCQGLGFIAIKLTENKVTHESAALEWSRSDKQIKMSRGEENDSDINHVTTEEEEEEGVFSRLFKTPETQAKNSTAAQRSAPEQQPSAAENQ